MTAPTLVLAGSASMLTGLGFGLVGRAVALRHPSAAARAAQLAGALWWAGLGGYLVLQGGLTIAAGMDTLDATAYMASRFVAIPLLCGGVWGLVYHLVYLFTGRREAAIPLAILYGAVALLFFWATFSQPRAVVIGRWLIEVDDSSPVYRAVYLLVGLPPILASFAYVRLLPRLREPMQRYRAALIGGSIFLYVGSGLVARLGSSDLLKFLSLVVLGVLAAGASLAAYYPPAALERALTRNAEVA